MKHLPAASAIVLVLVVSMHALVMTTTATRLSFHHNVLNQQREERLEQCMKTCHLLPEAAAQACEEQCLKSSKEESGQQPANDWFSDLKDYGQCVGQCVYERPLHGLECSMKCAKRLIAVLEKASNFFHVPAHDVRSYYSYGFVRHVALFIDTLTSCSQTREGTLSKSSNNACSSAK
ncbi:hypothetical protein Syun_029293 [Stephania yunnanensis]|uniref:Uncharacterized protein n=1 Tax=Stephania yunnanensis TaxID=152371 RepID=A0AAP0E5B3_9MAGN